MFLSLLLLLGIANIDTTAQSADKVLVKVVDDFEEIPGNVYTHDSHGTPPSQSESLKHSS